MAFKKSAHKESDAAYGTKAGDDDATIMRAGGLKTAHAEQELGPENTLVKTDEQKEYPGDHP